MFFYVPNFEDGAYWFCPVCLSICLSVHPSVTVSMLGSWKFYIFNEHKKKQQKNKPVFFSFLSLCGDVEWLYENFVNKISGEPFELGS